MEENTEIQTLIDKLLNIQKQFIKRSSGKANLYQESRKDMRILILTIQIPESDRAPCYTTKPKTKKKSPSPKNRECTSLKAWIERRKKSLSKTPEDTSGQTDSCNSTAQLSNQSSSSMMTPQLNEDTAMDNVQSENDFLIYSCNPTVQLSDYSSPSLMIPQLEGETTLDKIEDKPDTQTSSFKEGKSAA